MKLVGLLVLSLIAMVSCYQEKENVIQLNPDNFDEAISEFDNILIKFYAPWCGHCKNLAPIFGETAKQLADSGSSYKLGEIDCDIHTQSCKKYQIKGYPTILLFSKGRQPLKFAAKRQKSAIIQWLDENTQKPEKQPTQEEF